MSVKLHERVLVDCAPRRVREWGYWQFPCLTRMNDRWLFTFQEAADSYSTYGSKRVYYVSDPEITGWEHFKDEDAINEARSILLPNGDRVIKRSENSALITDIALPECVGEFEINKRHYYCYKNDELDPEVGGLALLRKRKGETEWVKESALMHENGGIRCGFDGCLPAMQARGNQFCMGPDGKVYLLVYNFKLNSDGTPDIYDRVYLMASSDNCQSFEEIGEIPYTPDLANDKDAYDPGRRGFLEPAMEFLKNGDILCVMRTTHFGIGPLYQCRSRDGGKTWSRPQIISDHGVYPHLVELECGAIVLTYGRPGVDMMVSYDNGESWTDHSVLIKSVGGILDDSCGYTTLLPYDSNKCVVGYSDFNYDPGDGYPRKALFSRIIEIV